MKGRLILLRHGQSLYNKENLFTGWTDGDLSEQGRQEAGKAGKILLSHNIYPDICFTSWLKRAIYTAELALKEMNWEHINTLRSWKLNERHYGAWQQQNKDTVKKEVGDKLFFDVRRGYDSAPPYLQDGDARILDNDLKYKNVDVKLLPRGESLKDTKRRTIEYFFEKIVSELAKDKTVLVSAHGNSLRALVMYLENIDTKDVSSLEISTGIPIVYDFDENMKVVSKKIIN